ncbi:MAG: pectin acetylesterase-family hydrolase [Anaerolineae bacterium]
MRATRFFVLVLVLALLITPGGAAGAQEPQPSDATQLGWGTIPLPGATCGTGALYKYFLNRATQPRQPLIIYFEGGGACFKEGPSPFPGGAARQLYCMNYNKFVEPQPTLLPFYGLFRRDLADNSFREANYAFIPYCTGDLHTGTATTPYDYDPDPTTTFNVTHRGHLNALAALDDLATRFPSTTSVLLTGSSAGALGALYNFPDIISRWPATTLVTDAGTLPDVPNSLLRRVLVGDNLPWSPRPLLPAYCNTDDCLADTTKLMEAHADHYNGVTAPWHPFGLLQGEQDQVLSDYMGITICAYQFGLRRAVEGIVAPNLRAFTPATTLHTFLGAPPDFPIPGMGNYRHTIAGVSVMAWMTQLVNAQTEEALPATLIEPWPLCPSLYLPLVLR